MEMGLLRQYNSHSQRNINHQRKISNDALNVWISSYLGDEPNSLSKQKRNIT